MAGMRWWIAICVVLPVPGAWALTAAELYDEAPPPLPGASLSAAGMPLETEVLTPQGIVDETQFTADTTLPDADAIEPAAGPEEGDMLSETLPPENAITPFTPPSPTQGISLTTASPTVAGR